jgi:hypothetical protein
VIAVWVHMRLQLCWAYLLSNLQLSFVLLPFEQEKCYTVIKQLRCKRTAGTKGCSRHDKGTVTNPHFKNAPFAIGMLRSGCSALAQHALVACCAFWCGYHADMTGPPCCDVM